MVTGAKGGLRWVDRLHRVAFSAISLLGPRWGSVVLRGVFDAIHRRPDPWSFETSPYERRRHEAVLAEVGSRPVRCCLEVGCSEGAFTRLLAGHPPIREVVALDVSPAAAAVAKARLEGRPHVEIRAASVTEDADLGGPYDLIVVMDLLYYLGVGRTALVGRLTSALDAGGRLVLAHAYPESERLHAPFLGQERLVPRSCTVMDDPVRPVQILVLEKSLGTAG